MSDEQAEPRIKVYKLRENGPLPTPGRAPARRWRMFPGPAADYVRPWIVDSPTGILDCYTHAQAMQYAGEIAAYRRVRTR